MKKVRIFTLGCKVNQYESQLLRENFLNNGFLISDDEDFNIGVLNSCCVTSKAEKECRNIVRRLLRNGKEVWITGCWVNKERERIIKEFPSVKVFEKDFLFNSYFEKKVKSISYFSGHTRAFIKIEDGCENFCSYCIIPFVRGRVRSRLIGEIVDEIKVLSENGYKEFVLTGVDLGSFGKDTGERLKDLIERISKIEGVKRIRISSIELFHIDDELIDSLSNNEKFCHHFHIPLQSGSDRILKLMRRRYKIADYMEKIEKIRKKMEDVTFTTDVMVGFPGEEDNDFSLTCNVIKELEFLKVHIFPFSLRKNTFAENLKKFFVDEKVKRERFLILDRLAKEVSEKVKEKFIGSIQEVLIERKREGKWSGYTGNYLPVLIDSENDLKNKILKVKLEGMEKDKIKGKLII